MSESKNNNECFLMVKTTRPVKDRFKKFCKQKGITIIECVNALMTAAYKNKIELQVQRSKTKLKFEDTR